VGSLGRSGKAVGRLHNPKLPSFPLLILTVICPLFLKKLLSTKTPPDGKFRFLTFLYFSERLLNIASRRTGQYLRESIKPK
jgi:hypothetical protein